MRYQVEVDVRKVADFIAVRQLLTEMLVKVTYWDT